MKHAVAESLVQTVQYLDKMCKIACLKLLNYDHLKVIKCHNKYVYNAYNNADGNITHIHHKY